MYALETRWLKWDRFYKLYVDRDAIFGAYLCSQIYDVRTFMLHTSGSIKGFKQSVAARSRNALGRDTLYAAYLDFTNNQSGDPSALGEDNGPGLSTLFAKPFAKRLALSLEREAMYDTMDPRDATIQEADHNFVIARTDIREARARVGFSLWTASRAARLRVRLASGRRYSFLITPGQPITLAAALGAFGLPAPTIDRIALECIARPYA